MVRLEHHYLSVYSYLSKSILQLAWALLSSYCRTSYGDVSSEKLGISSISSSSWWISSPCLSPLQIWKGTVQDMGWSKKQLSIFTAKMPSRPARHHLSPLCSWLLDFIFYETQGVQDELNRFLTYLLEKAGHLLRNTSRFVIALTGPMEMTVVLVRGISSIAYDCPVGW